jgi:cell division septum initiation protein DivIVA
MRRAVLLDEIRNLLEDDGEGVEGGTIMAVTVEALEKRLVALEQEVTGLRRQVEDLATQAASAQRGADLLREARRGQAEVAAGWAKALEQMGISGEPVGHEKLMQMMLECGINPEDNEFSREIIAMREE